MTQEADRRAEAGKFRVWIETATGDSYGLPEQYGTAGESKEAILQLAKGAVRSGLYLRLSSYDANGVVTYAWERRR